jgi:hypothetical protein
MGCVICVSCILHTGYLRHYMGCVICVSCILHTGYLRHYMWCVICVSCILHTGYLAFNSKTLICGSQGSSVSIVLRLRAERSGFDSWQRKNVPLLQDVQTHSGPRQHPLVNAC